MGVGDSGRSSPVLVTPGFTRTVLLFKTSVLSSSTNPRSAWDCWGSVPSGGAADSVGSQELDHVGAEVPDSASDPGVRNSLVLVSLLAQSSFTGTDHSGDLPTRRDRRWDVDRQLATQVIAQFLDQG